MLPAWSCGTPAWRDTHHQVYCLPKKLSFSDIAEPQVVLPAIWAALMFRAPGQQPTGSRQRSAWYPQQVCCWVAHFVNWLLLSVVQVVRALGQDNLRRAFHHHHLVSWIAGASGHSKAPLVGAVEGDVKHLKAQQANTAACSEQSRHLGLKRLAMLSAGGWQQSVQRTNTMAVVLLLCEDSSTAMIQAAGQQLWLGSAAQTGPHFASSEPALRSS